MFFTNLTTFCSSSVFTFSSKSLFFGVSFGDPTGVSNGDAALKGKNAVNEEAVKIIVIL